MEEFSHMADSAMGLIRYKGSYIYVSEADTKRLYHIMTSDKPLSGTDLLQIALTEEYEGAAITLTEEVRSLIRELTSDASIALPGCLKANMRPYQLRGFSCDTVTCALVSGVFSQMTWDWARHCKSLLFC